MKNEPPPLEEEVVASGVPVPLTSSLLETLVGDTCLSALEDPHISQTVRSSWLRNVHAEQFHWRPAAGEDACGDVETPKGSKLLSKDSVLLE